MFVQAHKLDPGPEHAAFVDVARAMILREDDAAEALALLKRAYKSARHPVIKDLLLAVQADSGKGGKGGIGGLFGR